MTKRAMGLGALLLSVWGCGAGTEPELVATGGALTHTLTAPMVQVSEMTALPPFFKGARHIPTGINGPGEIAGTAYGLEGVFAPVVWHNGGVERLGDPAINGEAFAINDAGQLAAPAQIPAPAPPSGSLGPAIRIWETATGAVIYDNQLGADETSDAVTTLKGGQIQIHQ